MLGLFLDGVQMVLAVVVFTTEFIPSWEISDRSFVTLAFIVLGSFVLDSNGDKVYGLSVAQGVCFLVLFFDKLYGYIPLITKDPKFTIWVWAIFIGATIILNFVQIGIRWKNRS